MKHLFLSGGGDVETSKIFDAHFFDLLSQTQKILYIPIALERNTIGYEECFDWFSQLITLQASGKDLDFTMWLANEPIPELTAFDALYIGGGNTYKLLDFFIHTNVIEGIRKFINSGKPVYGGSAGAIILGKDIRTVEEENDKKYQYHLGLDLLLGYSVRCHYTSADDQLLTNVAKTIDGIIALPEGSGLSVGSDQITAVGDAFLFENGQKKIFKNL